MTSTGATPSGRLGGRRVFLACAAVAVGLGAAIPAAWLIVPRGLPLAPTVVWIALAGGITALAVHGARGFRRAWTGQLRAERERMLALERLTASERRRIETEHLASVGRLAGQIAHELSNPLAVVKANLRWLEAAPPGEAAEVLSETNESVRRITRIVDEMRALAGEPSDPVPVDPAGVIAQARRLLQERTPEVDAVLDLPAAALPPASGGSEQLARALAHLAAQVLAGAAERRVTLAVRIERHELAFTVSGPPVAAGTSLAGSLDVSLAAEFAAQGNGYLEPIEIAGAHGFSVRVPVAPEARATPAPFPAVQAGRA